jgi:peroxiredoxin
VSRTVRIAALASALALAASARAEESRLRPFTRGATPALAGTEVAGGRELSLAALRGRAVLVVFWASWCDGCDAQLTALETLRSGLRGRPFELLTVNYGEGRDRVRQVLRDQALELPVLLDRDHEAARAWGVGGLPMAFLVDARGRVRSWVFGEADFAEGELAAALERLIEEAERAAPGAR